jgi:glycosyltransferase involved in cell wall biosynthesis
VTFANLHLPALSAAIDAPFVLGPVAGGQRVARCHFRYLGLRGRALEASLRIARLLARANPVVRFGWRRASVILLNNSETAAELPRPLRAKAVLRPAQCVPAVVSAPATHPDAPPTAICSGRLHRFKGVELAIRSLTELPGWRLRIVGNGPDGPRLRALALRLGLASQVDFIPSLPQQALWEEMSTCDAFVLPSLKEGGGFAAVEAAALGLPVVAFDQGGPAAVRAYYLTDRFRLVPPEQGFKGLARVLRQLGKRTAAEPSLAATADRVATDLDRLYELVTDRPSADLVLTNTRRVSQEGAAP